MVVLNTPAGAQSFSGRGSETTAPFPLQAGVTVFGVDYIGSGDFTVRLLDADRRSIGDLVDVTGPFSGTPSFRVPQAGEYRLEVRADGAWNIQRRRDGTLAAAGPNAGAQSDLGTEGRRAGESAVEQGWSWSWFGQGLLGGSVAGPLGMGVVFVRAGRSDVELSGAASESLAERDPLYAAGFREGFEARLHARRREAAAVGGLVGTGVFLYVILQVLDFDFGGSGGGREIPLPPGG